MGGKRPISPKERALWNKVTSDVKARRSRGAKVAPVGPQKQAVSGERLYGVGKHKPAAPSLGSHAGHEPRVRYTPAPAIEQPPKMQRGLDGKNRRRMERGKLDIDGRIDLHGMTEAQAHQELERYIISAASAGKRLVLVITGKGKGRDWQGNPLPVPDAPWERKGGFSMPTGSGVLRRMAPQWLAMPPLSAYVVETAPAQPKHGGSGAIYVYLRRQR